MKHSILVCVITAGLAWAQSPEIIQNTRTMMQTVDRNATAASNEALDGVSSSQAAGGNSNGVQRGSSPLNASSSAQGSKAAPAKKVGGSAPAANNVKAGTQKAKPVAAQSKAKPTATKRAQQKKTSKAVAPKEPAQAASSAAPASTEANVQDDAKKDDTGAENKWAMSGKRDPFISPVVSHAGGSGCSTGKKCLDIGDVNLRGIVQSENGFIAVVTNNLNKAYFLRENDPVFNGYVIKITGDSITFKEMLQDHLGKPFTREVVKKIVTPAV